MRLRDTVTKLAKTITNQNSEIDQLRQLVTNLTLARAVLIHTDQTLTGPDLTPDNVIPFSPRQRESTTTGYAVSYSQPPAARRVPGR